MHRQTAHRVHAYALAAAAAAAVVAGWAWSEATKPVAWAGRLTEGWKP